MKKVVLFILVMMMSVYGLSSCSAVTSTTGEFCTRGNDLYAAKMISGTLHFASVTGSKTDSGFDLNTGTYYGEPRTTASVSDVQVLIDEWPQYTHDGENGKQLKYDYEVSDMVGSQTPTQWNAQTFEIEYVDLKQENLDDYFKVIGTESTIVGGNRFYNINGVVYTADEYEELASYSGSYDMQDLRESAASFNMYNNVDNYMSSEDQDIYCSEDDPECLDGDGIPLGFTYDELVDQFVDNDEVGNKDRIEALVARSAGTSLPGDSAAPSTDPSSPGGSGSGSGSGSSSSSSSSSSTSCPSGSVAGLNGYCLTTQSNGDVIATKGSKTLTYTSGEGTVPALSSDASGQYVMINGERVAVTGSGEAMSATYGDVTYDVVSKADGSVVLTDPQSTRIIQGQAGTGAYSAGFDTAVVGEAVYTARTGTVSEAIFSDLTVEVADTRTPDEIKAANNQRLQNNVNEVYPNGYVDQTDIATAQVTLQSHICGPNEGTSECNTRLTTERDVRYTAATILNTAGVRDSEIEDEWFQINDALCALEMDGCQKTGGGHNLEGRRINEKIADGGFSSLTENEQLIAQSLGIANANTDSALDSASDYADAMVQRDLEYARLQSELDAASNEYDRTQIAEGLTEIRERYEAEYNTLHDSAESSLAPRQLTAEQQAVFLQNLNGLDSVLVTNGELEEMGLTRDEWKTKKEEYETRLAAIQAGDDPEFYVVDDQLYQKIPGQDTLVEGVSIQVDGESLFVPLSGTITKDGVDYMALGDGQVIAMDQERNIITVPGQTVQTLTLSNGETFRKTADGEWKEYRANEAGVLVECTAKNVPVQGCDQNEDGVVSTRLSAALDAMAIQQTQASISTVAGDTGKQDTKVAEADRIYDVGWGGRDFNAAAAIMESFQLAGSTQWLSDLVIGPEHSTKVRDRYDRWMSNVFTTEYVSSAICSGQLPEVLPGEGLGQIIDSQGNPVTVAHITGQKHGPQPYLCDLESEEVCPDVDGVECKDMVCEVDGEPLEGFLYILEWSVRLPSPLMVGTSYTDYLGFQVTLDKDLDTQKHLYEDTYNSPYPIVLEAGAQDGDRIITYSLNDYNEIGIYFEQPIKSAMGKGTTSFMERKTGTTDNLLRQVTNSIVEVTSPTTFSYSVDDELPPSTLSSTTSTVEQVQI